MHAISPLAACSGCRGLNQSVGATHLQGASSTWLPVLAATGVGDTKCLSGEDGLPPAFKKLCNLSKDQRTDNIAYRAMIQLLAPILHGVSSVPIQYADSYDVPWSLKGVPATASFVGREAQLDRIEGSLQPSSNDRKRRSIFVVCGLGGIGKTQLVVEYARKHQHSYSGVFWLDGASRDQLRQSFLQVARRLPHEQLRPHIVAMLGAPAVDAEAVLEEVLRWLS
ncbi:hypothetical protein LTR22_026954 [Elasticomyces elasticus]|nr:hypothetical protein LTR22_026954 [Elasticomyces elasticus]KAK4897063.1 hypothetical protein LTR49_028048 [Elasticomyces elasticus]KAK5736379.1 hypothetical protein LTS12_026194 [Elasticomyces elasticus]